MSNELFKKVTESTGLPANLVSNELGKLLSKKGLNASDMTMEELRQVLSQYLKDVIIQAKDAFDQGVLIEEEISPEELGHE